MSGQEHPIQASKLERSPTASRRLPDGGLIEMVYDPEHRTTALAHWHGDRWSIEPEIRTDTELLVPFSPDNNIVKNRVVLLPSQPESYGDKESLLADIQNFLHRYLDVSAPFELVATQYVLFTWLYDSFNEVPYIRFQGDYGTGKTRALLVVGSLCYKAFFASGASTVSPIFHILDAFRGTLILDEADFRFSDEKSEIIKVLNNGNVDGIPVLRTMMNRQREFNPQAFRVFGPKIVAMRKAYDDQALESRFLTEVMGQMSLRDDVPINLPPTLHDEARALRNKLLLYRFHNVSKAGIRAASRVSALAPRSNQILIPLLSITDDAASQAALIEFASTAQSFISAERGLSLENQILEIIRELGGEVHKEAVPLLDIAQRFSARFGQDYERPISSRWIGTMIRQRLHLTPYKSNGRYLVGVTDSARLQALYKRYGLTLDEPLQTGYQGDGDLGSRRTSA